MLIAKLIDRLGPFIVPVIFFSVSILTIADYGMNWDSPTHFARGQAFLRYILTGKPTYDNLLRFCIGKDNYNSRVDYKTGEVCDKHRKVRVSEYQANYTDLTYLKKDIYGHPPLSDIFAALTNQIFFIKLGWFEDIEAYHLYNIFTAFLLALTVSLWVKRTFGAFASIIAGLAVYLFPLLLGEQHFNIKDLPMAAFFTIALYFFWRALTEKKALYMLFSAIAGGISFSTKFNYLFAPIILFPWTALYIGMQTHAHVFKKTSPNVKKIIIKAWKVIPKTLVLMILLYPFIVFSIFYFSWPVLWSDPVHNVALVFKFYKDSGVKDCPYSLFTPSWFGCSNPIPTLYFATTLPLITLFFFVIGFFVSLYMIKRKRYVTFLWLTFLLFTILRVSLPNSSIYGGIRQMMEFIAPTAMITGVGAFYLRNFLAHVLSKNRFLSYYGKKKIVFVVSLLLIACYIPIAIKITTIHPNENVYFNPLIGGLKGAKQRNIYAYGNTYGNGYYQAVQWLNQHAEKDAKIALLWGLGQNLSRVSLRDDFSFTNEYESGYNQKGEYLITTMEQGLPVFSQENYKYADRFLNPVYILKVDDVPIVKIWKNDAKYIKPGVNLKDEQKENPVLNNDIEKNIIISLDKIKELKRLEIVFNKHSCVQPFVGAQTLLSFDGVDYKRMYDEINSANRYAIDGYHADFIYLFAGDQARYIKFIPPPNYPCSLSDIQFSLYTFSHLYSAGKE